MKRCRFMAVILTMTLSIGSFGGCSKNIFPTETEATRVLPEIDTAELPEDQIPEIPKGESIYEKTVASGFRDVEYSYTTKRNKIFDEQEKALKPFDCRAYGGNVYAYTEDGDRRILVLDTDSNIQREIDIDDYWTSFFPDVPRADIKDHPQTVFNNYVLRINNGYMIGYGRCFCYVDLFDESVNKVIIDHDYWSAVSSKDHLVVLTREGDNSYLEIFSKNGEKSVVDISDMIVTDDKWYTEDENNCMDEDQFYFRIVNIRRELYGTLIVDENDMSVRYAEAVDGYDPLMPQEEEIYYWDRLTAQRNDGYYVSFHTLLYTSDGEEKEVVVNLTEIPGLTSFLYDSEHHGIDSTEYIAKSEDEYYILENRSGHIITVKTQRPDKEYINILIDETRYKESFGYTLRNLVLEFNANSDEYYCRFVPIDCEEEDYESEIMAALRSDDPPDIVLSEYHYSFLDDSGYFADLSSFAEDNINEEDYYMSVIEGARSFRDDKLYSLPLSLGVQSITWVNNATSGATFEEYMEKVKEERFDPLWGSEVREDSSSADYLKQVYAYQSDLFRKTGEYDVNTESFYRMLDFVKNNNYARYTLANCQQFDFLAGAGILTHVRASGEENDPRTYPKSISPDNNFNGYPTADGRGPGLLALMCILVNNEAIDNEGVTEFLKYSVSPLGQYLIGPMCIPVFNDYAELFDINVNYEYKAAMFAGNRNIEPIYDATHGGAPFVASKLDEVKEKIGNMYVLPPFDPAISIIVAEESKDYLNDVDGVITPESVAARINARIDKLMEERGTRS